MAVFERKPGRKITKKKVAKEKKVLEPDVKGKPEPVVKTKEPVAKKTEKLAAICNHCRKPIVIPDGKLMSLICQQCGSADVVFNTDVIISCSVCGYREEVPAGQVVSGAHKCVDYLKKSYLCTVKAK